MPNVTTAAATAVAVGATVPVAPQAVTYVLHVPTTGDIDPTLLDFGLAFIGAFIGAMKPLGDIDTTTTVRAVLFVTWLVAIALLLTWFVISLVELYMNFPMHRWPGVVSFGITFLWHRWERIGMIVLGIFGKGAKS